MTALAAIFHQAGSPFTFETVPVRELQEGETLVEVICCSLCRSDLHTQQGLRNEPSPTILGHEILGRVIESRAGMAVGTRVTWGIAASCGECYFCLKGIPQKCGELFKYGHMRVSDEEPLSGGLATHILLRKGTTILAVPDALSDEVGSLANCAMATASAVIRASGAAPGDVAVVMGAGILGVTACAMLHSRGCQVFVFDRVSASLPRASAFGAAAIADNEESLRSIVAEATSGRGADVCLELSGQLEGVGIALKLARTGGSVVLAGTTTPVGEVAVAPEQIVRRLLKIVGVHNYAPADLADGLEFLRVHHRAYPFQDLIGPIFPLTQVDAAFSAAGQSAGKRVMVRPNG